jgi:hypothetical protein
MTRNFFRGNLPGLIVSALAFCLYLATLSPFMIWEDSGELATVAATLGVAHPTGYPVFSLLGRVFSLLPLGDLRVIVKLNVMVALFCALAVACFYRVFLFLLSDRALFPFREPSRQTTTKESGRGKGKEASPGFAAPLVAAETLTHRLAAAFGALALAFSWTFWFEAVSFEVYALHLLMMSLVTLLFLRSMADPASARRWLLFAYVLGLSFAHHMMTVLLAPAFLTLYFSTRGFGRESWIRVLRAIPAFLLGLTPYIYLPVRASTGSVMNWGDPSTWERFLFHVSGGQYRFKMFSSAEVASRKFGEFADGFIREFGVLPLLLAVLGIWATFRFRKRLFAFTALLFATGVLYAVNYDFEDPNFYLPAWVMIAAWAALGTFHAMSWARARGKPVVWLVAIACCAAAAQPLLSNYRDADESRNHAVEDHARNVLASVGSHGVLFTTQSEILISPAYYLQRVEGYRPDVVVIDQAQVVGGHAWYFQQLDRLDPELLTGSRNLIRDYTDLVLVLRRRMPLEGPDIRAYNEALESVTASIVRNNLGKRPLHVTIDVGSVAVPYLQQRVTPRLNIVPEALAFRVFLGSPPVLAPRSYDYRPLVPGKGMVDKVAESYAIGYTNQAGYQILAAGDTVLARTYLNRALALKPGFPTALQWLRRVGP